MSDPSHDLRDASGPGAWGDARTGAAMPPADVYTVSRLNREARVLLERGLGSLWIEGEVSNLSRPGSGHWYFTLKDAGAQLRCAMFRQRNLMVRFPIRDGGHVLARGRVGLYEPRGEFQLVVEHLEEAGEGQLRRRYEELKLRLAAEGLFDLRHKQALPRLPRRIGVVTSPTGAAIRDILHVLRRRFPAVPVLVYPVAVQGAAAPGEIAAAIALAGQRRDCDVLIVARGGGSLEDLWAFNEEAVARAIHACPLPVVSGVGHEVDVTIADLVADERAPTPSAAAERVVPDRDEWLRTVAAGARRLESAMRRRLADRRQALHAGGQRLARVHPGVALRRNAQRLDELGSRMARALRARLRQHRARCEAAQALLQRASPALRVAALRLRLEGSRGRLASASRGVLAHRRQQLGLAARTLHAVSPLATLDRGYAIVTGPDGHVAQDATALRAGDRIAARLARGTVAAAVLEIRPGPPADGEPA
jgi:exodeoxyribonuclease VII large subunit